MADNFLTTKDSFHSITDRTDFLIFLILDKEIISACLRSTSGDASFRKFLKPTFRTANYL